MSKLDNIHFKWRKIGSVSPEDLVISRRELHHAVQLVAAAGKYLVPERADDSHTSMHWDDNINALFGETIGERHPIQIGIRLEDLKLLIKSEGKSNLIEFSLPGETLPSALSWMKDQISAAGINVSNLSLKMHYDIPHHPVAVGKTFKKEIPENYQELSIYFDNANNVLHALVDRISNASRVRCWPHHFDIATLITFDKGKSSEEACSIGAGLSTGDEDYNQPYFYITPWPYPDLNTTILPELSAGRWYTEGWVGVVLPALDISTGENQKQIVIDFILSGIDACTKILGVSL